MKIAIIDNFDSFVFNLVRYIKETDGVSETKVMRNNVIEFAYLESCDGILLSPGPGIPSEAGQMNEVIKTFHTTKPILGVCLGHQAIVESFKGKLEQAPKIYHGKATEISIIKESVLFKGVNSPFIVGRYHSWQVNKILPNVLHSTSEDKLGNIMSFEHKSLPIYGVQFHPESVLTPQGRKIIENWISICKKAL